MSRPLQELKREGEQEVLNIYKEAGGARKGPVMGQTRSYEWVQAGAVHLAH
jgi:hypothetical protein